MQAATASGRFTAGLHGLLAQLEREKNIENIHLGNEQAVRSGFWINRPPTGYDLVDRVLVANDDAHLVRRAFTLRAAGGSYPDIEGATGLKYSTVRHALDNRGVPRRDTAARSMVPRSPRSSRDTRAMGRGTPRPYPRAADREGLAQRTCALRPLRPRHLDRHQRSGPADLPVQAPRQGCEVPGRTSAGLHRAARLRIELLRTDDHLIEAIRAHLATKAGRTGSRTAQPSRAGTLASLRAKRQKLFDMLDDKISDDYFAEQEHQLTAKINALTAERSHAVETIRKHNALADAFEQAAALLRDPTFQFVEIWDNASARSDVSSSRSSSSRSRSAPIDPK